MSRERRERQRRRLEAQERKLPPGPMTAGRLAHGILTGLPDFPDPEINTLRVQSQERVPKDVADGACAILMGTVAASAIESAIRAPDVSVDLNRIDNRDGTFDVALTLRWRQIR